MKNAARLLRYARFIALAVWGGGFIVGVVTREEGIRQLANCGGPPLAFTLSVGAGFAMLLLCAGRVAVERSRPAVRVFLTALFVQFWALRSPEAYLSFEAHTRYPAEVAHCCAKHSGGDRLLCRAGDIPRTAP